MLEKYEKDFDENEFMRSFMERKQISTKKQALAELRKLIKKEGYYQTKIKEALKKKTISEDEARRAEEDVQKLTDRYIGEIDKLIEKKEQELLQI